jgi:hypothetical protein
MNYDISPYGHLLRWYTKLIENWIIAEAHEEVRALAKAKMSKIVLYGHALSQPSRALEAIMKLNNIEYELRTMGPQDLRSEKFLRANPLGQVPCI